MLSQMGLNRTYDFVTISRPASDIQLLGLSMVVCVAAITPWLHISVPACNLLKTNIYASPCHIDVYHLGQSLVSSRCFGDITYVLTMHVRSKDKI